MAVFCSNEGGKYRKTFKSNLEHMEFILDSAADVASLPSNTEAKELNGEMVGPCAPGSVAMIPSTGAVYMMDNTGSWYAM